MSVDFRSAVFHLCQTLSVNTDAIKIRNIIYDMSVVVATANDNSQIQKRPPHGDLAQIAVHHKLQFLGYLLADEVVDDINRTQPFQATRLDETERNILEIAYATIQLFISECTKEIKEKYPKAFVLIDPYSLYKKPIIKKGVEPFLNNDDVKECAEAFKSGRVYKRLTESDALLFLDTINENTIRQLCVMQQKQFSEDYNATTKETTDYVNRIQSEAKLNMPDQLMAYSVYCYALRKSLEIAAQMLFEAIMGHTMLVMDNDNIINLETINSDTVYERYVVLIQGAHWSSIGSDVGNIVLLSCSPSDNYSIKKFGVVFALTVSFIGEFGDSTKISMVTIDEDLNEIHHLTDTILSTKIGNTPVKYQKG